MKYSASVAALVLAAASSAAGFGHRINMKPPPLSSDDIVTREIHTPISPKVRQLRGTNNVWDVRGDAPATTTSQATIVQATFQQQVDHSDPSQGTFSQRYWYSTQFWTGPGAPVVFFTPGESEAADYTGYLTNRTITGLFAQAIGGAVVMLEHRYWGESSPFDNLTTKNLRFLTLANSIADTTNFARTVHLPFDNSTRNGTSGGGASNAPQAPWVMSGGSYSGALTAWVEHVDPGTYWAYHASSAVVESIGNFWQYFEPVRAGLPANCSADVQRVIAHVDDVLTTGTAAEIQALKDTFGLGSIVHDDDFATALENGPWTWQGHDFDSGYSSTYQFCDYVENAVAGVFNTSSSSSACRPGTNGTTTTVLPGADGVGLKKALNGYAKWTSEVLLPGYCSSLGASFEGNLNTDCFDSYNASSSIYTDTTVGNPVDRQWTWLLCNEPFMFWQTGAPEGTPTLVSRLADFEYSQRQCDLYFPPEDGYTYGSSASAAGGAKTPDDVNAYTGGWSVTNTTRLIWANGEFDPWRDATVSSDFRPGGPLASTPEAPVNVIPGGIHCSDLIYANAQVNAGVLAVVEDEIAVIKGWVEEFYEGK